MAKIPQSLEIDSTPPPPTTTFGLTWVERQGDHGGGGRGGRTSDESSWSLRRCYRIPSRAGNQSHFSPPLHLRKSTISCCCPFKEGACNEGWQNKINSSRTSLWKKKWERGTKTQIRVLMMESKNFPTHFNTKAFSNFKLSSPLGLKQQISLN